MPYDSLTSASAVWHSHAATFANYPTNTATPPQHFPAPQPSPRRPQIGQALALGVGSLLLPVLGPMAWMHAGEELSKMQTGEVRPVDQPLLHTAKALGIVASAIAASATAMLVLFALVS